MISNPSAPPPLNLTPKEKSVLEYIEIYVRDQGYAPTFTEIQKHFQFASINSVQNYLKQLSAKGFVHLPGGNSKRAIQILRPSSTLQEQVAAKEDSFSLPLLGKVAAGRPLEALSYDETIEVPSSLVRNKKNCFSLQVVGQSMIDDGILDGDYLIIQEKKTAHNGEIIVAVVDNEATVKRFFNRTKDSGQIELRPANSQMQPMFFHPQEVEVKGSVVALFRKY